MFTTVLHHPSYYSFGKDWLLEGESLSILAVEGIWPAGRSVKHIQSLCEATLLWYVKNEAWHCPAEISTDLGKDFALIAAYSMSL